jgi:hypothetical protein
MNASDYRLVIGGAAPGPAAAMIAPTFSGEKNCAR